MTAIDATPSHEIAKHEFVSAYRARLATGGGTPVRLGKRTSNLFRTRTAGGSARLDARALDRVIRVDPLARRAEVEGMATYETIVAATLPYGLMPAVVPELKSITLGGATSGVGIESSSFKYGLVHETVTEIEVLTGSGDVVVATAENEYSDLFRGFPNSYGTLGYALRLGIDLVPIEPCVELTHTRFTSGDDMFAALPGICASGENDFVDGTVFSPGEMYVTTGRFVRGTPELSDYTAMGIYYRSVQRRRSDHLSAHDYIWRWDTDWFWCSRAFHVQNPWIRALIPRRYLRSTTYWKLMALDQRLELTRRIHRMRHDTDREMVIQDVEIPVDRAAEFLAFFQAEIGIEPVWICPLRAYRKDVDWSLYTMEPDTLYVNFGFWGAAPVGRGEREGELNRTIETTVERLGGRKSLYSTSWYSEEDFWRLYGGETYRELKKTYDPGNALRDLYEKCVLRK